MNLIQKEACPEAYEPEIVTVFKKKKEEQKREQDFYNEIDKTLFDFDDEIDNLSDVEERYKCNYDLPDKDQKNDQKYNLQKQISNQLTKKEQK